MLQKRLASFDQMIYSRTHARVLFILGKQNQLFLLTTQPQVQGSSKVWKITLRPRKYNKYFAVLHTIYMYRQTNKSVVVSLTTLLWLSFAINFTIDLDYCFPQKFTLVTWLLCDSSINPKYGTWVWMSLQFNWCGFTRF